MIVVNGDSIAFEDTFVRAVQVALGNRSAQGLSFLGDVPGQGEVEDTSAEADVADEPDDAEEQERAPVELSDDAAELAEQAQDAFEEALDKQREGDWAGYGEAIERLGEILQRLAQASE